MTPWFTQTVPSSGRQFAGCNSDSGTLRHSLGDTDWLQSLPESSRKIGKDDRHAAGGDRTRGEFDDAAPRCSVIYIAIRCYTSADAVQMTPVHHEVHAAVAGAGRTF